MPTTRNAGLVPAFFGEYIYQQMIPEQWRLDDYHVSANLEVLEESMVPVPGQNYAYPFKRFMGWLGEPLDELKDEIDGLLDLFSVDRCPTNLLPYLAAHVGLQLNFDPSTLSISLPEASVRELIRNAVPSYKRKGTIPMIVSRVSDYLFKEIRDNGWTVSTIPNEDLDSLESPGARLLGTNDYIYNPTDSPPAGYFGNPPLEFVAHVYDVRVGNPLALHTSTDSEWHTLDTRDTGTSVYANFTVQIDTNGDVSSGAFPTDQRVVAILADSPTFMPSHTELILEWVG